MELYENAIQTDRAFIYFNRIAHISWKELQAGPKGPHTSIIYEVKIYSDAGMIIQSMTSSQYLAFMKAYRRNTQMKIVQDVTGIDINGEIHGY
tara:strand:- start:3955 stop:4233 length:279 start_codon:yes stop_codon:yes gene_type:complete